MARLYLIRHGKPLAVWGGADEDPGLDETGRAQVVAAAGRLMALPAAQRPGRVVSSPLRRCRETAEPLALALGVPVEIDPAIGEIPTPAGLVASERPAWLRAAFTRTWSEIDGDIDYQAWRRDVVSAVGRYEGAAVFSHFVAINAAVSALTGQDQVIAFRPDHASITTLQVGEAGLQLVSLGAQAATGVL
jgi:broad specificity phosphatase PhoE